MSDYDPNLGRIPGGTNQGVQYEYRDPADDGRSGMAILAVLAGVTLLGGFLYFGNPLNTTGTDEAQLPVQEQTLQRVPAASTDAAPAAPRTEE
jgi:hypothetical protein